MLSRCGIISPEDSANIVSGLHDIKLAIEKEGFEWRPELEDVHMNIEKALTDSIGEAGGRLHTARSRNDQVATDLRIFVREKIFLVDRLLAGLQGAFIHQARDHMGLVMPGFTHLQKAQPVLWSHHMLAYFQMFRRDRLRLKDCLGRVNISPLGSAALAGTGFGIDRFMTARELGFDDISANSLDAVSDRDFAIEFVFVLSMIMMHLSRLSEELVLWSSSEFSYVELPDAFCTGSSIMPQKKNPDVPELVRGKTGRVYGHLVALLTLLKGLPLAYNRDLQEDKEALFDALDTCTASLNVMKFLIAGMKPLEDRLMEDTRTGFLTATDLADYLVKKGIPFRKAHEIVGKAVAECIASGRELTDLTLSELKSLHPEIDEDVFQILDVRGSVDSRKCPGGTGTIPVMAQLEEAERWLADFRLK
jgi:argininosuccinate lyase